MNTFWRKILLFIKFFALQSAFFMGAQFISEWDYLLIDCHSMPFIDVIIKVFLGGFIKAAIIGGFLFVLTSLIYIVVHRVTYAIAINLFLLFFYVFFLQEYIPFDYSIGLKCELFSEKYLLFPLMVGVISGILTKIKDWELALKFIILFFLQTIIYHITSGLILVLLFEEYSVSDLSWHSWGFMSFCTALGLGGLLFAATSLTFLLVKGRMLVIFGNLIWIFLYVFILLGALLKIWTAELIIPFIISVYGGWILFKTFGRKKNK